MNYVPVVYLFGWLLAIMSAITLIPAAIALNYDETRAFTSFMVGGAAMAFLGGILILSLWGRVSFVTRSQSLILLTSIWLVMPFFASIPLILSGYASNWTTAYFEAASGLTTTGATIFDNISELPKSIIAWRSILQWLGGLLTLLGLVFLYGSSQEKSFQDINVRLRGRSSRGGGWFSETAFRAVLPIYAALSTSCFVLLIITGIPAFDAFCISMSTVSTGGFMPRDGSMQTYGSIIALPVMAIFMYLGAVSVFWVRHIFSPRKMEKDRQREPGWIASVIVGLALLMAYQLIVLEPIPGPVASINALIYGLATATSLISTTGFVFTERLADAVPYIALLAICFVGGGRMSTAGGLKFNRLGAMLLHNGQELHRLIYPHGITSKTIATSQRGNDPMRTIWVNFAIILIIMTASTSILSLAGLSLSSALLATVSALSNIGPAYELISVPGDAMRATYSELETFAQMNLAFVMIFGRIQILAILSLINFSYWQN